MYLHRSLKTMKIIYWVTTLSLSIFLLWSTFSYLFHKNTIEGITALGFPDYFRVQLAVLKFLAVAILLTPWIPLYIKEWAYVGIGLFILTAIVAHAAHKDPLIINFINVILMSLTIISRNYLYKIA